MEKIHQVPPCQVMQRELQRKFWNLIRCLGEAESSRAACKALKITEALGKDSLQLVDLSSGCVLCSSFRSTFAGCHAGVSFGDTEVWIISALVLPLLSIPILLPSLTTDRQLLAIPYSYKNSVFTWVWCFTDFTPLFSPSFRWAVGSTDPMHQIPQVCKLGPSLFVSWHPRLKFILFFFCHRRSSQSSFLASKDNTKETVDILHVS